MKLFRLKGVSKRYALRACMYRRIARNHAASLDFSEAALRALFEYESRGSGSVDKAKNGYAYGKWLFDVSVSMWIEDIEQGNFCKAEFMQTAMQRLHNRGVLASVVAPTFFPHSKY